MITCMSPVRASGQHARGSPCWAANDRQPRPNRAHMATHCGDGNAPPWPAKTVQHARAFYLTSIRPPVLCSCLRRALVGRGLSMRSPRHLSSACRVSACASYCSDAFERPYPTPHDAAKKGAAPGPSGCTEGHEHVLRDDEPPSSLQGLRASWRWRQCLPALRLAFRRHPCAGAGRCVSSETSPRPWN